MFIVARFFAGAGSWGFLAITPLYSAELAPPGLRGLMVGMNGVNIALGYALATYMGLAFYYVENPSAQWRGPLGIALIWPVLMVLVCFILPESPRYLLMKGRVDEAREVVFRLHAIKGDVDNEFAREEFYQMSKQAELDRTMDPGWLEMFRRPSYRKRTLMAMGFAFIGQSTGVLVLNNYGPTIYAALGYDTLYQLIFQCGWISVGIFTNLLGALVMDWTGRRPLLMIGVGGCCVSLILEAAMVSSFAAEATNKAGLEMGVAAAYLFIAVYGMGIDVAGVVFYSELFPNHLRAKGIALSIGTIALTDLVYLQVAATAFANIGWKFYLVFIIISGLGTFFVYFFLPETKNIPLEEMAKLFGDEVAVYAEDLHVDQRTHELIVDEHGVADGGQVHRVATEAGGPLRHPAELDTEKEGIAHAGTVEHVDSTAASKH
ncbi:general substrate transporter [Exophiala viscosa]|uniref:general substrate transporter n=1 Tax=Exophiala viscosa TaxID=2486360 RepID=UPI00218DCB65|nr:general substrate transporter [Exophiala viscosa]